MNKPHCGSSTELSLTFITLVPAIRDYDIEEPSPVRFEKYGRDGRDRDAYDEDAEGKNSSLLVN